MMRSRYSWTNPQTLLAAACVAAGLLAVVPWRYSSWVQTPANLLSVFVSPLQNGFTKVLSPIAVKRGTGGVNGDGTGRDGPEFELLRTRCLQFEQENQQLRAQVESLQAGIRLNAGLGTSRVVAPSLGLRGSLLQLRTDHLEPLADGASPIGTGSVVVIDGVNLVGRVVEPGSKVTLAQLVADSSGREIRGVVRPREREGEGVEQPEYGVRLTPTNGGRLTGSVYLITKAVGNAAGRRLEPVQPGARVRLADPEWPRFAQMLILGEVESVSTAQNDRQMVTVRPMYEVRELAGAEFSVLIQPPLTAGVAPSLPSSGAKPSSGGTTR